MNLKSRKWKKAPLRSLKALRGEAWEDTRESPLDFARFCKSSRFRKALRQSSARAKFRAAPIKNLKVSLPFSITEAAEQSAEAAIRNFVLHGLSLAVYDPNQFRRPKVPVASFEIELLEFDEEEATMHAAGPVILKTAEGDVEQYLRVSVPVEIQGDECRIVEDSGFRAAYIVDLDSESGACKETAALANA